MRYKTIYGFHEARMWVGTIIAGVAAAAAIAEAHPEIKESAKRKWNMVKDKFKKKPKLKIVVVNNEEQP